MAARFLTTRLLLLFLLSEFNYSAASSTAGNLGHSQSRPDAQRNGSYRPPQRKQPQDAQTNPWSKVLETLMKIPSKTPNKTPASPQAAKPKKTPQNLEISIKWPEGQTPLQDQSSLKPVDSILKFLSQKGLSSFIKSLQWPKDKDSPMVGKPDQKSPSTDTHGGKNKHVSKPSLNHRSDPSTVRREPAQQSSTHTGLQNPVVRHGPGFHHPHHGPGFHHPHHGPGFHHPHHGPGFHSLPQHSQSRIPIFHPSHHGHQAHGHHGHQAHGHQVHGHHGHQAHGHQVHGHHGHQAHGDRAHGHHGHRAHGHRAHGHHPLRQQIVAGHRLATPKLSLPRWV